MENENDNVDALARDFKQAYPDDKYSIIGYDKEVKLLVIQIPENERDQIRKTIMVKYLIISLLFLTRKYMNCMVKSVIRQKM